MTRAHRTLILELHIYNKRKIMTDHKYGAMEWYWDGFLLPFSCSGLKGGRVKPYF